MEEVNFNFFFIEFNLKNEVETGQVAMTNAGNLKCKNIIHAVGPIWKGVLKKLRKIYFFYRKREVTMKRKT